MKEKFLATPIFDGKIFWEIEEQLALLEDIGSYTNLSNLKD